MRQQQKTWQVAIGVGDSSGGPFFTTTVGTVNLFNNCSVETAKTEIARKFPALRGSEFDLYPRHTIAGSSSCHTDTSKPISTLDGVESLSALTKADLEKINGKQ